MFDMDEVRMSEAQKEHSARTSHLSDDEKKIFNDGYLWASGDSLSMLNDVLIEEDISDSEKIELLNLLVVSAKAPLMMASIATGKNYLP